MKKYLIMFLVLICVCGCTKKEIKSNNDEELKGLLKEYGDFIFLSDEYMKGNIEEKTYKVTLRDLDEKWGKDITKFLDRCDKDNTYIEFIVKEQAGYLTTNYEFNYVLECED